MTIINAVGGDRKVKVSLTDKVTNFLANKLIAGAGITINLLNSGGNEQLEITTTAAGDDPDLAGLHYLRCREENGCIINVEVAQLFDQTPCWIKKVNC